MSIALTEKEFVSNFLTLATIEPFKNSKDYFKPYEKLEQLGVALPALPCKKYKYQPRSAHHAGGASSDGSPSAETGSIELTMKSVRPPKFSISKKFATNQSIHNVKEYLVQEVADLVETQQLKVLLKGKVLQDSYILNDLDADSAALTVMVSKPSENASAATLVSSTDEPASPSISELEEQTASVELPWSEIEELLKIRFGKDASKHIARLQRGWELTK